MLTVNTSVSQQIRASVVDEIVEESLYNQIPTNRPVCKASDMDTVVSEGSDDSGEVKRPAPLGQEMGDEAAKVILYSQGLANIDFGQNLRYRYDMSEIDDIDIYHDIFLKYRKYRYVPDICRKIMIYDRYLDIFYIF